MPYVDSVDGDGGDSGVVGIIQIIIMLAASSRKRNVTVWRPSVSPPVCPSFCPVFFLMLIEPVFFLTLIGRAAHVQRVSPGGSTRRGQHTFQSEYFEDGHTCY